MNEREVDWNTTLAEVTLAPTPSTPSSSSLLSPQADAYAIASVSSSSPSPSLSQPSYSLSSPPSSSSPLSSAPSSSSSSSTPSITTASSSPLSNATSNKSSSSSSSPSSSSPHSSSSSSNPNTPLTPPPTPPTVLSPCQMTFREAVQNGDTMELQRLLEEREGKINVNLFDKEGQTALHHSCLKGNLELVKLLVRFGADVTLANRDGWHPLHLAASRGHSDILVFLLTVPRHRS